MNALRLRDPYREMEDMREAMDRMLDRAFAGPQVGWQPVWNLALDVVENDDEFVIKASIPGINPDDLDITFNERTLTIKGESKGDEEREGARYHLRERWYGSFTRSVQLPTQVKTDDIQATYDAGVLTLRLPKTEEVKPKRIPVKVDSSKLIDAKVKK